MSINIGDKIKKLRLKNKMTLKDLGEKAELSIGFLSQLERGLTTISVDVLDRISTELNVELTYFFKKVPNEKKIVMRNHEKKVYEIINSQFIHYHMSNDLENKNMIPRIIDILPNESHEKLKGYSHIGEEFLYVVEGILTLTINDYEKILYPGDTAHYNSNTPHNWSNATSKKTRIVVVATPNGYNKLQK